MPFAATWKDLKIIILSEVSQIEKGKYHVISFICGMLKKKKDTNELIYKTEISSQRYKTNSWLPNRTRVGEG